MPRLVPYLSLVMVLAACQPPVPPVDAAAEEQAILAQVEVFNGGLKAYDEAAMVSVYAPDAVLLPPNQGRLTGTSDLQEYFSGMELLKVEMHVTPETVLVAASGDQAIEIGNWTVSLPTPKGGIFKDNGKYMAAWKKTNGIWLMQYDIWNSDNAPPAAN